MKVGFVSLDHLRDWHGTTRLIDQLAAEMGARGHSVVIIAHKGTASPKVPVSLREYPHELITLDLSIPDGRKTAREKIAASGMDVCAASVNDSMLMYIPWLFRGSGIPYVLGDPGDPRILSYNDWQPFENFGALASADAIQTLLEQFVPFYPQALRQRLAVIGIPAPPPAQVDFAARRDKKNRTLITVGRFVELKKRFSLLMRAFALLREDFPDWRLKLVGDGIFWDYYQVMAGQLGITEYTEFTGAVANPGVHYESADLFCLPSRDEGFGLVLAEAASYALPLVGFRGCLAIEALIAPGMGAIAEDAAGATPEALANALRPLMALSPEERETTGAAARDWFQAKYGGSVVYDQWENLLIKTFENARNEGTVLERSWNRHMEAAKPAFIGPEWNGLEPDSPIWTKELLERAAVSIAARDDPMKAPERQPGDEEAESVRLRCELARLRQDYDKLEKKHNLLLAQYQTAAGKAIKHGKRK